MEYQPDGGPNSEPIIRIGITSRRPVQFSVNIEDGAITVFGDSGHVARVVNG